MSLWRRGKVFVIWALAILLAPAILYATRIVSITLCQDVSQPELVPVNITTRFTPDSPAIHAVVVLEDVKPGTKVKGAWISVDAIATPNYEIDSSEVIAEKPEVTLHFSISRPNKGWPAGNYKLNLFIDGRLAAVSTFSIAGQKAPPAAARAEQPAIREAPRARPQELAPVPREEAGVGGFSGSYILESQGTRLTLVLKQDAQGNITGRLTGSTGAEFVLEGKVEEDTAVGICHSDQVKVYFEAALEGNQLQLALIEPDANNMPDYTRARQLVFTRQSGAAGAPAPAPRPRSRFGGAMQAPSQEAKPEIGGDEVGDPSWGFKFRVPAGWKYKKELSGVLLGHDTIAGMVLILPHMAGSSQEVQQQMMKGLAEEGTQLSLVGQLQPLGRNALAGDYQGIYQSQPVKARGVGTFSPHGGGAYILAVSTPEKFSPELSSAADSIAQAMSFFRVEVSEMMRYFAGTWATHTKHTSTEVTLLPNGEYVEGYEAGYTGPTSGGVPDWSMATQQGTRGRWSVRGTREQGVIVITLQSGEQRTVEYRVHTQGSQVFWNEYLFNGTLYYRKR